MKSKQGMYILELICVILSAILSLKIMYVVFGLILISFILGHKKDDLEFWVSATIYSIIVPDNYTSAVFSAILFVGMVFTRKRERQLMTRTDIYLLMLIVVMCTSSIINAVPLINIFVELIYIVPFFSLCFLFSRSGLLKKEGCVQTAIERVLQIELLTTIVNFFVNFIKSPTTVFDGFTDWSYGTFGTAQQSQLCVIAVFAVIYKLYNYKHSKKKKDLLEVFVWVVVAISTYSWAVMGVMMIGIIIAALSKLDRNWISRISRIALVVAIGIPMSFKFVPNTIKQQLDSMVNDESFRNYRAYKLITYSNTFIKIPQSDTVFFLVGNGLGYYASRGALTCTGLYVINYNNYFAESMSDNTQTYIYPRLKLAHYYGTKDYGSVISRPYSSIIAVMGEFGYIGLIVFALLFFSFFGKKNIYGRMLFYSWMAGCVVENYIEYPRVVIMLFIMAICISEEKQMDCKGINADTVATNPK